jgi:hypothetical protein
MKKSLLAIALLLVCGYAFAAVGVIIDNTPYTATDIKCASGVCSFSGSTLTIEAQ